MSSRKSRLPWNWRSRIEITRLHAPVTNCHPWRWDRFDPVIFELAFKKGQTPKGCKRRIGILSIYKKSPHFVEEVHLDNYFVKRGLGTKLYLHALKELGSLSTHYNSASDAAKGLWRRLVKRSHNHRTDFFAGTLTIFNRAKTASSGILR